MLLPMSVCMQPSKKCVNVDNLNLRYTHEILENWYPTNNNESTVSNVSTIVGVLKIRRYDC